MGWLDPVFVALSLVGYAGAVWIVLACGLAIAARRPIVATTALAAATVWAADLLSFALKAASDRPRPFDDLAEVDVLLAGTTGTSLPSGHAATSFAGAVVLGFVFRTGLAAFVVLASAIAFSRVYVGAHYPLDVAAGAALGAAVGLAAVSAVLLRRRSAADRRRSEAAPPKG